MLNTLFRAYVSSPVALKVDSWPEKIFRRAVWAADSLESALAFQARRFRMAFRRARQASPDKDQQESETTLLAVYNLKANGLTFDFLTFLAIVELERQRRGRSRSKVIVYAPPEFPIYQWQRLKVFNNMDGKPLIRAERKHVLAYVRKLSDVARIFSKTMRCDVVDEQHEIAAATSSYPHVFPRSSKWTGNFQNMTEYKTYSRLKHTFNGGRDAVVGCRHYRLGEWLSERIGGGKLVATVNFRNQNYSTTRNANLEHWEKFFSHPFIKRHFHFVAFNDAETPVTLRNAECITFCDRYIHDNFRRFKTLLNVGLHIGTASGSTAIVSYSDVPYLLFGPHSAGDMVSHLNPDCVSIEGDFLLFDRDRRHQLFSFKRDRIMEDVHLLLTSISRCTHVLERYPESIRVKLTEILRDWPGR